MALVDYFLKIKDIEGESGDAKHKNEIQLESWSWGETQTGASGYGGGGGAGKVQMQDFHFTMKANKASPKLMLHCAIGKHIPEAVLTCRKAGGKQEPFYIFTFSELLISSYQTGGAGASDVIPMEQISFNFTKIKVEYKMQNADGSVTPAGSAGYDLKKQEAIK